MLLEDLAELLQEDTAELLLDNAEELDEDFGMLLEDIAKLLLDIVEELDETTPPEDDDSAVCSGVPSWMQRTDPP